MLMIVMLEMALSRFSLKNSVIRNAPKGSKIKLIMK
jgi:hypothetical protein